MFNRQQRRQLGMTGTRKMPEPGQIIDSLMKNPDVRNNPRVQEVMRLRQMGDTDGLNQLGNNICQQNGTSFEKATGEFQQMMTGYGYRF